MELGFLQCMTILLILVGFVMWLDDRQRRKAMKNGCICNLDNSFVNMIRHDCPYHFPINKIKRGQKWLLDDDNPVGGPIYAIVMRVENNHVTHYVEDIPSLKYTDRFEDFLSSYILISE